MTLRELLGVCCLDNIEGKLSIWLNNEDLIYENSISNSIEIMSEIVQWWDYKVEGFYPDYKKGLMVHVTDID